MNEDFQKRKDKAIRLAELASLKPITFEELEKEFKEVLLLEDPSIIKLLLMIIVANRLKRDPLWMFIIGPSGGGKTELLTSLFDLKDIYAVSLLTPNTLLSGAPGKGDMSLLPRINGQIMLFKDWTYFQSQNREAQSEIMGQFREVYDGFLRRPYGNGKVAEWHGKIGIIAGTTPAVDISHQMHATLGERFVQYRLKMPDRKLVAMKALQNSSDIENLRKRLKNAIYSYFLGFKMPEKEPVLPEKICKEIVRLTNFTTMARSGVIRDTGSRKEVIYVPAIEMPTRISSQLSTLCIAAMIINGGELTEDDLKNIIYKIALDSIPQTNRMVLREMAKKVNRSTKEIAHSLGYPTAPIKIYLENLALLGVCIRRKGTETEEGGSSDRWELHQEFTEILQEYEILEALEEEEESWNSI